MRIKEYVALANQNDFVTRDFDRFKKEIFKHTLLWEGVSNISKGGKLHVVPGDSGGYTIWGIAYNKNKEMFSNFDEFKNLTYEQAAAIAFVRYYKAVQAFVLPKESQLMYFDMAYNLGVGRAIRLMQRCAGVREDGVIGPMTRSKMKFITEDCLYQERIGFYNSIVKSKSSLSKFLKGWLNRSKAIKEV